jgi:hypothetical protein
MPEPRCKNLSGCCPAEACYGATLKVALAWIHHRPAAVNVPDSAKHVAAPDFHRGAGPSDRLARWEEFSRTHSDWTTAPACEHVVWIQVPAEPGAAVATVVPPNRPPPTVRVAGSRPACADPIRPPDGPAPARAIVANQTRTAINSASSAARPACRKVAVPAEPVRMSLVSAIGATPESGSSRRSCQGDPSPGHGQQVRVVPPEVTCRPHRTGPDCVDIPCRGARSHRDGAGRLSPGRCPASSRGRRRGRGLARRGRSAADPPFRRGARTSRNASAPRRTRRAARRPAPRPSDPS